MLDIAGPLPPHFLTWVGCLSSVCAVGKGGVLVARGDLSHRQARARRRHVGSAQEEGLDVAIGTHGADLDILLDEVCRLLHLCTALEAGSLEALSLELPWLGWRRALQVYLELPRLALGFLPDRLVHS